MKKETRFLRIDHIQLAAPKGLEEQARRFFGQICGMEEIPKPDNLKKRGGVWFRVGSNQLHIGMEDPDAFHPSRKAHPAFEVDNLKRLEETLKSNRIAVRIDEPLEGSERFYTEDPFGNRLEFIQWSRKPSYLH